MALCTTVFLLLLTHLCLAFASPHESLLWTRPISDSCRQDQRPQTPLLVPLLDLLAVSTNGVVEAYNMTNGEPLWTFATPGPPLSIAGLFYVERVGLLLTGFVNGFFSAIEAKTGRGRWNVFFPGGPMFGTPYEYGGIAVVLTNGCLLHGVDLSSSAERWTVNLGQCKGEWSDLTGGGYYVGVRVQHYYYCVDIRTGAIVWKKFMRPDKGLRTNGVFADGLFVFGHAKMTFAYYPNGTLSWSSNVAIFTDHPVVTPEGMIVFPTDQLQGLSAIEARSGIWLWWSGQMDHAVVMPVATVAGVDPVTRTIVFADKGKAVLRGYSYLGRERFVIALPFSDLHAAPAAYDSKVYYWVDCVLHALVIHHPQDASKP